MLLTSSILSYYSTNPPAQSSREHVILVRVAHWLSIFLRRLGKLIAVLNAVWIVVIAFFQFSGFFDRCFCNSNIMGPGKHVYVIISLASGELGRMRGAQIGGFFLAAGAAIIFSGLQLLVNGVYIIRNHARLLVHFKENYVPKPYFFRPSFGMLRWFSCRTKAVMSDSY
jgi:hypothetical protein